jgi:formylmethanofuran dehydrogenase subunit E
MEQIGADADGFEDIIAIVEVNSCMVDGIQFTGGFTLGNNGLVYSDIGKSAVTFVKRNQEYGLRFYVNRDYMNLMGSSKESGSKESGLKDNTLMQKVINENNRQPELVRQFKESAFRGAFEMLDWDFTRLFKKERVKVSIPGYAKIVDSFKCSKCGEQAMITRCRKQENKDLCPACFGRYMQVSGSGIAECLD